MGFLGSFSRFLNAVRIYLLPSFPNRLIDKLIFEFFCKAVLRRKSYDNYIIHLWDTCPSLIDWLHKRGAVVVLDVCMAPNKFFEDLFALGILKLNYPSKSISNSELMAFSKADFIIAPSTFVAKLLIKEKIEKRKISIIPFGVDLHNEKKLLKKENKSVSFCFIGNINERKGIKFLLSAWENGGFKNDKLHLCGRIFPEFKSILKARRNIENIRLHGFVDISTILPFSDVFVFPSLAEGSSKAIYEAMSYGLPVITTENSGSVVRNGVDGFIVEAGDSSELVKKMIYLKNNPQIRTEMGKNARNRIKSFSWDKYSANVYKVYSNISISN
jgi:glycosyltransferase involved in cell wall biosynthesis